MAAALTVDIAELDDTPSSGKTRDLKSFCNDVAAAINDHAATINILDPSGAGVVLTADAAGRARIAAGFFDAATVDSAIAAGAIGQELLEPELDATALANAADAAVSPASTQPSIIVGIPISIPDAATQTLAYVTTRKIEIFDVTVMKTAAGAGNTIKLQTATPTDITNAIAADTDKVVTRAGTCDPATRVLAAGATLKILATRAAGSMACEVIVHAILRA